MQEIAHNEKPRLVLHMGTSGGLSTSLKSCDPFVANKIIYKENTLDINPDVINQYQDAFPPSVQQGTLLTSDTILKNGPEKTHAHDQLGALAVDMESYFVASFCQEQGIPYLSYRSVFDERDEDLENMENVFDVEGNLKPKEMVVNLLKKPRLILELNFLRKRLERIQKGWLDVIRVIQDIKN